MKIKRWVKFLIVGIILLIVALAVYVITIIRTAKALQLRVVTLKNVKFKPEEVTTNVVVSVTNPGGISMPSMYITGSVKNPVSGGVLARIEGFHSPKIPRKDSINIEIPVRVNWLQIGIDTAIDIVTDIISGEAAQIKSDLVNKLKTDGMEIELFIRPKGIPWTIKKTIKTKQLNENG